MLVRAFVADDPAQAETAKTILGGAFSVSASVLVETEWVLRSVYRWPRQTTAAVLLELCDLAGLTDAPSGLRWALGRFAAGADFADMIHLISAGATERFATFDRQLALGAGPDSPLPVETLA